MTTCTNKRRQILARPEVDAGLIDFGRKGAGYGAWIGKYVLMPDHLHVFVALDEECITLANWMKSLKNTLSKILRARKISSPHWRKTFFDHVLRGSESYNEKWEYVAENPVRAGLVKQAQDWPFQGELFPLEY